MRKGWIKKSWTERVKLRNNWIESGGRRRWWMGEAGGWVKVVDG